MPALRYYPPAVIAHVPQCAEGSEMPAHPIDVLLNSFYSHKFDACFGAIGYNFQAIRAHEIISDGIVPMVAIERVTYRPHEYIEGSGNWPSDAIRERCRFCFGTHGEEERVTITIRAEPQQNPGSGLILPSSVQADREDLP